MKIAGLIILSLLPVAFSQSTVSSSSSSSDDSVRVKRAGFNLIGGALQNLQKSAFSASASLSAGSSSSLTSSSGSLSSSSSSSQDAHGHSYDSHTNDYEEPHHDTKSFDGWQLKKSILNTLLQAVKAIAGGVTTLKGQLIKGSGYLVSQKGKLIASGGDAVSNAGKSIIASAHLIKPESSGHGQNSIGHSLGSTFSGLTSGLTKSISGLSAGSAGSISSLSSGSAGHVTSLSSSSSAHGSGGSSGSNGDSHGEAYASPDGPSYNFNIPETNYGSYDAKPAVHLDSYGPPKVHHQESYGPPKQSYSYSAEPHQAYGAPEYDGSYKSSSDQEASDVLSEILKNLPHKPMKSIGYEQYSGGQSFNQIPIPDDVPPPFKPLNSFPSYNLPFESSPSQYDSQNHYSDFSGQSSNKRPVAVTNPKSYEIYHSMKSKFTKEKNFVTLPTLTDSKGLEILKSIRYEIKA